MGERAAPKSSSQYTLQDLEVSADTDFSFGGTLPALRCDIALAVADHLHARAPAAIAKRVLGLLAVAVVGGVVLFYAGLPALRGAS